MKVKCRLAKVGREWSFEVSVEAPEEEHEGSDQQRFKIAIVVLCFVGMCIVGLGSYGLYHDNFKATSGFWVGVGPLVGAIFGYYFGKKDDDP